MGIVLCDIDSTVADTRHRSHMSPHAHPDNTWESYGALCSDDNLIAGTRGLLKILHNAGHEIWFVTGRPAVVEVPTKDWLIANDFPFDSLRTYQTTDHKHHVEYKRSWLRTVQEMHGTVILALDDWPSVVDMYEEEGVPCICINPRYEDNPMRFFIENGYQLK
jgi:acid phosphatase class B